MLQLGQVEPDLLGASLAMLTEVAIDAKRVDRDPVCAQMLVNVLTAIKKWSEKLFDYHMCFDRENIGVMESVLPSVFWLQRYRKKIFPVMFVFLREGRRSG